jgi:phosphopantothenoylcysteine decarboxylase
MAIAVLLVCGAPLAQRVDDMVRTLTNASWETYVVGTPASEHWMDADTQRDLNVRFAFRQPKQAKRTPPPDALVVCPATFNTTNKITAGIADNYVVSLACESIGDGVPTVVAPMVNNKLWTHFRWQATLSALIEAGVYLLDVQTGSKGTSPVLSGTGDAVVQRFQPLWLVHALEALR